MVQSLNIFPGRITGEEPINARETERGRFPAFSVQTQKRTTTQRSRCDSQALCGELNHFQNRVATTIMAESDTEAVNDIDEQSLLPHVPEEQPRQAPTPSQHDEPQTAERPAGISARSAAEFVSESILSRVAAVLVMVSCVLHSCTNRSSLSFLFLLACSPERPRTSCSSLHDHLHFMNRMLLEFSALTLCLVCLAPATLILDK